VYNSPSADNGYEISDFYNSMDEFRTMGDFDRLLTEIKKRGLKLIMDLVVNHTSDEHAWFEESRESVDNPKRDYYIWKPGKNGSPPNNWQSFFGGDAWVYDQETDEYYLHLFTKKQPDLNWENPKVRREVYDLMTFWMEKGIDGFRMDVISLISKAGYADSPFEEFNQTIEKVYANGPRIHEFLQEMNQEVMARYDMMTVGEGPGINLEQGLHYTAEANKELDMVFHFDHMFLDQGLGGKFDYQPYDLVIFKKIFSDWDARLADQGWNSIFLGNHDFPRIVSRFGNDETYRTHSAKLLCLTLMTLRGTSYVYQGDELGMTNVAYETIDDYRDIETLNVYREAQENGADLGALMKQIHIQGRDNARTPMQWNDTGNAGFTSGTPWIKVNPNYPEVNAASQESDESSVLNFYRKVIQLRKEHPVLIYGDFQDLAPDHHQVFVYRRWQENQTYLVVHNYSSEAVEFEAGMENMNMLVGNYEDGSQPISEGLLKLRPWESVVFEG